MIAAIVAVDKKWGIGKDNKLLCDIPGDMKHFKEITLNGSYNFMPFVICGRKTFDTIGKPLYGRMNVVITSAIKDDNFHEKDGAYYASFQTVLRLLDVAKEKGANMYIIGGGTIYEQLFHLVDTVYLTKINAEYEADTFFHDIDNNDDWQIVEDSGVLKEENTPEYRFITYKKKG